MKRKSLHSALGFTMLEVLFAGTVLALATFTVLGLLKLSDEMSYRAKVDSKLSQVMKARASLLVSSSFQSLRDKVSIYPDSPDHSYIFQNGKFLPSHINSPAYQVNNSLGFPFVEVVDQFSPGTFQDVKYLLSGKPLPGGTQFREIFPFIEQVYLQFDAVPSAAREVEVTYSIYWINEFYRSTEKPDASGSINFDKLGVIEFIFKKYDPKAF